METPQNETTLPAQQEQEKKRSPWLIILLILLVFLMGCCILGAILCRGSRRLPGVLERYLGDVPGLESGEVDFWGWVEDFTNDPKSFNPQDYLPGEDEFFSADPGEMDQGLSLCSGLSGNLEMQVLVGPADVAGLEPLGIGSIPLAIEPSAGAYLVTGNGTIDYQNQLDEVWGFYVVSFDSTAILSGTCTADEVSGILEVIVVTEGEQLTQVFVGNDEWSYPWSGEYTFELEFPIEDGAVSSGEGWAFVLHLD
jgi:hypothetical protein